MYTFVYTYRHKQSGKINSIKFFLLLSRHIWRINTKRISIFYFMLCCACWLSHVQLFSTPWAVAHQAPLSMEILQARILEWVVMAISRRFPNPGIEPRSPALQEDSLPSESPRGSPRILEWVEYPFSMGSSRPRN